MTDAMQNIEYILETGAGWAGPIKRGYVVFKFPYEATNENVLLATTAGYQFLYNEIFWSFENLEPTSNDNINVSIVSPNIWQEMVSWRRELRENPKLPEDWLNLANTYEYISTWHGPNIRDPYFYQKIPSIYEAGISANPDNASLYSNYAEFINDDCCYYFSNNMTPEHLAHIEKLIDKALALDPQDSKGRSLMGVIQSYYDPDYAPPAAIPPTATSPFTATPSITPSPTITSTPTETPVVVTVVQTKLVYPPTSTSEPTETNTPTLIPVPTEAPAKNNASSTFFGALFIFVVGAGSGWFLSKRQKK